MLRVIAAMEISNILELLNITKNNVISGIVYTSILTVLRQISNFNMSKNKICVKKVMINEDSKIITKSIIGFDIFITVIASLSLFIGKNYLFGSIIGIDSIYQLCTAKSRYWKLRNIATVYTNGIQINGAFSRFKNGKNIRISNNILEFSKNGKKIAIEMENNEVELFVGKFKDYRILSKMVNENGKYDITIAST